jgi:hypothetical protein
VAIRILLATFSVLKERMEGRKEGREIGRERGREEEWNEGGRKEVGRQIPLPYSPTVTSPEKPSWGIPKPSACFSVSHSTHPYKAPVVNQSIPLC